MGLFGVIGRQLQHPKGLLGKALFGWMTAKTIAHARWTADLMDVQADDNLLEVGFGNGANIELLVGCASNGHVLFKEMYRVLKPGGLAAVTFPVRDKFMRFGPARTDGFHLHELADLEAAFRDAGFIEARTEHNDGVRFGAHCMLGRKRAS
jgi:SAM-dependent methyltransferase